jgi:hypothetical protein
MTHGQEEGGQEAGQEVGEEVEEEQEEVAFVPRADREPRVAGARGDG